MKYFSKLAALLIGAALIFGFAGCANPSNSDESDGSYVSDESNDTENVVYTLKNGKKSDMTISYKNKSGEWTNEQTVPGNGTYEIPASDAKRDIKTLTVFGFPYDAPVIYLKIKVGDTEVEGFIEPSLEKVVCIHGVEATESGKFYHIEYIQNQ